MSIQFTARPTPSRRPLALTLALVAFLTLWHTFGAMFGAVASTTGSVAGQVWEDVDRDGIRDADEAAWANQGIALYDGAGNYVDGAASDADGAWRIDDVGPGTYTARMGSYAWQQVRDEWVPTTTAGVFPEAVIEVTEGGVSTFDLGWRLINWSTSLSEPISTATAGDGVVIETFNDAMEASDLVAALDDGTLRGDEAPVTTIRFASSDKSYCGTSVAGAPGSYADFKATCYVSYNSWLTNVDTSFFHEYGHAWSQYHRTIVNQWGNFDPYLEARGIDPADDRIGSSHAWTPGEMIAEDYRQLFGSPSAAAYPQENQDIPPATEVDGLAEWLAGTFMLGGSSTDDGSTADTEAPTASDLSPTQDSTVSGSVTASVSVSDDTSDIDGLDVSILLDGVAHAAAYDSAANAWEATLDTTAVADGTVVLEAQATDEAGNTASVSHEVVLDNTEDTSTDTTDGTSGPTISAADSGAVNHGSTWTAWVDVTVTDGGDPVVGAVVEARWTGEGKHGGSGELSCTTDATGQCRLSVDQSKRVSSVTFDTSSPSAVTVTVAKP